MAFTGDTTSDFMLDPRNADALRAKILITEVKCDLCKEMRIIFPSQSALQLERLISMKSLEIYYGYRDSEVMNPWLKY